MIKLKFNKQRPEQSLGFLLWQTTHAWQRDLTEALKPLGLTHTQYLVLAGVSWLSQKHAVVTQVMLAAHANIDVMMTSNVVRTLLKKGLILREEHPKDTRAHQILLSDAGNTILQSAIKAADEVEQNFFGALEEEHSAIHRTLLKLLLNKEKVAD